MADLDTLRPEVKDPNPPATAPTKWRAEHCVTHHHACDCREWEHATRVAELEGRAEKAEAELAALTKKCTCSRRSVSSPFGCRVCNPQLEIADLESKLATSEAELATAQNTINAQQDTIGALKQKLALSEGELAALKARIAEAPVAYLTSKTGVGPCNVASMAHGVVFDSSSYGKSVRVVLDE